VTAAGRGARLRSLLAGGRGEGGPPRGRSAERASHGTQVLRGPEPASARLTDTTIMVCGPAHSGRG